MLSFERVLEAFREHLTEDTGVEVVPTRHGYTYLTWDDRRENWDTAEICLTPEALLDDFKTLGLLFESLALHDLWVYARANGMGLYHYHDARDLEVDAVVAKPGGTWVPVEVKLSSAQLDEASDNLVAVEERMVAAGNEPPAAKVAVIGYGSQAHVTERGVQVVPLDVLAP